MPGKASPSLSVAHLVNDLSKTSTIYKKGHIYDCIYQGYKGDMAFYLSKAKKGKVLYMGIGTGRIFGPLYSQNNDSYGMEISNSMISVFKRKFPHIPYSRIINDNALEFKKIRGKFDIIIAPYCFLNYFHYEEITKILKNVLKFLKKDGIFITDVFSPYTQVFPFLEQKDIKIIDTEIGKARIEISYNHIKQEILEFCSIKSGNHTEMATLKNYYYYPAELNYLFKNAGFKKIKVIGGFKNEKPTTKSDVIVFEALK